VFFTLIFQSEIYLIKITCCPDEQNLVVAAGQTLQMHGAALLGHVKINILGAFSSSVPVQIMNEKVGH
jgi:hypothetical protein